MEKENIYLKIEAIMKGNGGTIWCMERGYCTIQMAKYSIKVNGNKMNPMDGDKCIPMKDKGHN